MGVALEEVSTLGTAKTDNDCEGSDNLIHSISKTLNPPTVKMLHL